MRLSVSVPVLSVKTKQVTRTRTRQERGAGSVNKHLGRHAVERERAGLVGEDGGGVGLCR